MPTFETSEKAYFIPDLLFQSGLAISRGAAKRAIRNGNIKVDGKQIDLQHTEVNVVDGMKLELRDKKVTIKVKANQE